MRKIIISLSLVVVCVLACIFIFTSHNKLPTSEGKSHNTTKEPQYSNILTHIGVSNGVIEKTEIGSFYTKSTDIPVKSKIHLVYDYEKYCDKLYHDSFLVIETENDIMFKHIGEDGSGSYGDTMYVCDIDGDHLDEIVVHSTVGMSGGAGQYAARVYKIYENGIIQILDSSPGSGLDTGFVIEFIEDFEIVVLNSFTGYKLNLDYSIGKNYIGWIFDENGKVLRSPQLWLDSFCEFVPEDLDGDGVFEIKTVQYSSLDGHTNFLGNAISILKYNTQTGSFDIVDSSFETVGDGSWCSSETTE